MSLLRLLIAAAILAVSCTGASAERPPVRIGLTAEFGHTSSTSAQAIRLGILTAVEEINGAGGVLDGRPLELEVRDNRSIPARGVADLREFARKADTIAVFGGKFSPVMLDMAPVANELEIPLLDPWAAADGIVDNGFDPNYVFRLALKDSWALSAMIDHARRQGKTRLGMLVPNTGWGRSSLAAARAHLEKHPETRLVEISWYNWGNDLLFDRYGALVAADAEAVLMVANELEGAEFLKSVAQHPVSARMPLISHWGISGGDFVGMAGDLLNKVDLTVVQTFTFAGRTDAKAREVLSVAERLFGLQDAAAIPSPVGFAHAYDLTHILARAIEIAGEADRRAVRGALEKVRNHAGLVRHYEQPFSEESHEALRAEDVFIGRFQEDGTIVPVGK